MEKVIETELGPEAFYEILDADLTEILQSAGVDVDDSLLEKLLDYNRYLRIALGLPVEVAN